MGQEEDGARGTELRREAPALTLDRRRLLGLLGSAGVVSPGPAAHAPRPAPVSPVTVSAPGDGDADHARFMRAAVGEALRNPQYPFGAVLVRSGRVLGRGVNTSVENPTYHGEMVAMADYVRRAGNDGWTAATLYSTGEPCAMCMSACAWAGVGQVVWGTSIDGLGGTGLAQIALPARAVADAAGSFWAPRLLGGVLAGTTDALFRRAEVLRGGPAHGGS
ncbi:nucleoside deaminase [Streptomyces sp. NPDC101237]|uniref:nucleoside deaminase n=1 Tax=Streptomyces sp. NPDC101237 TaxID=3366139 RepID=UPI00382A5344